MPIVVGLFALIALIYGAVQAFHAIQAAFGLAVALGVAVLVALLLVAAVAYWLRRRRQVAANVHGNGDWTHELKGAWGLVRLAAAKRFWEIHVGDERGAYIFADLLGAEVRTGEGKTWLAVKVTDPRHREWLVPMAREGQAKQWQRILLLAKEQKL
ncbi:hypothetical protein [Trinickia dinghuensis]|uniref:Uncharacterized protein n=1 Tax=Trinickia dinghuensis TaxID=2291023 RepID=A0A3D8JXA3_9BURK|nr:hypothetical protein [Trinickia dinghuensis]RDU97748.1 hypothetical protein DWV00_17950 [Trinickia dinghuensis]